MRSDMELPVATYSVEPHRARRMICGYTFELRLWPTDLWKALPDAEKPPMAQAIGTIGWLDVQPVEA